MLEAIKKRRATMLPLDGTLNNREYMRQRGLYNYAPHDIDYLIAEVERLRDAVESMGKTIVKLDDELDDAQLRTPGFPGE